MILSNEQVANIEKKIDSSSIISKALKDDLLDHFCCAIEIYIAKGLDFEEAFNQAQKDICPNGLNEIQSETLYLLNSKKIILMKKALFTSGLIFSMAFSLGFLFKLMYWPIANEFLGIGIFGLGFIFLPLLTVHQYRSKAHKILSEKLKYILGALAVLLFSLASIFKILHLQGAELLLVASIAVFTFGFLPFLFFRMYKKSV